MVAQQQKSHVNLHTEFYSFSILYVYVSGVFSVELVYQLRLNVQRISSYLVINAHIPHNMKIAAAILQYCTQICGLTVQVHPRTGCIIDSPLFYAFCTRWNLHCTAGNIWIALRLFPGLLGEHDQTTSIYRYTRMFSYMAWTYQICV